MSVDAAAVASPAAPTIGPPHLANAGPRLRTLVNIRWASIACQAATVLFADLGLGLSFPFLACMAVIGLYAAFNAATALRYDGMTHVSDRSAIVQLAVDIAQVTALLFLTGGLINPFAVVLIVPVIISATILDVRSTAVLTVLSIAAASLLTLWAMPPPLLLGEIPALEVRKMGLWTAMCVTLVFVALYVFRMAKERRATQEALAATQMALAREQRVSSLGALAAAVVHELGTPLSTIAVAAREMERGLSDGEPFKEDARLILDQAARCRDALRQLAERPEDQAIEDAPYAPIGALVELAAQPYASEAVSIVFDRGPVDADAGPEPLALDRPELRHAIAVYVENAVQFAASQVEIAVQWDAQEILVVIQDDGPGFAPGLLDRLGEPYLHARADTARRAAGHLGLGVFIAQTLLDGVGARVRYANADAGGQIQTDRGARIAISWPRSVFERLLGA